MPKSGPITHPCSQCGQEKKESEMQDYKTVEGWKCTGCHFAEYLGAKRERDLDNLATQYYYSTLPYPQKRAILDGEMKKRPWATYKNFWDRVEEVKENDWALKDALMNKQEHIEEQEYLPWEEEEAITRKEEEVFFENGKFTTSWADY